VPTPVDLDEERWAPRLRLERQLRDEEVSNEVLRRRKIERIVRSIASGEALEGLLGADEARTRELARRCDEDDPRIDWIAARGREWKRAGEKTLVFAAHRESLELLRRELSRRGQLATSVFHEDLSPAQRDIAVAQFRLPSGPSLLVSSEAGGEGRNFQFCRRIVLFDLPWNPVTVEQRIGRLDRIGRRLPVEIVYFRPPAGVGAAVARLYEEIGIFRQPLGGLDRELADLRNAIEDVAAAGHQPVPVDAFGEVVASALEAESRIQAAAYQELHREPYDPKLASGILSRIPEDLEDLTEEVVLAAAENLGLVAEPHHDGRFWSIELGSSARVESLPGVPGGSSFVGTFRRELAVESESEDYFSSGHPLVEGLLAELEDSPCGRVAVLHISRDSGGGRPLEKGVGLAAIRAGADGLDVECVDQRGRPRPDWSARLAERPLRTRRFDASEWMERPGWREAISRLSERLSSDPPPSAVALVRVD
jgi:ATP-dependent helicase HepA